MSDSMAAGAMARPTDLRGAAVDELYRLHASRVHRFCLSQVGDPALAEDLTHETFMRAFAAFTRVHPDPATAHTWLLAIARNLCHDHHRWSGRRRLLMRALGSAPPSPPADVGDRVEQRDEIRRVTSALETMRPRQRELIGLRVAADLSYRQIAELLGTSESVVKVATHRAITSLRSRLEANQ